MRVLALREYGYDESVFATGLSKGLTSDVEFEDFIKVGEDGIVHPRLHQLRDVCGKLAGKGNGHDNFLTGIIVWLDIDMPTKWWRHADRYHWFQKVGAESTMHTLMKRKLTSEDFASDSLNMSNINMINQAIEHDDFDFATDNLPASFLERRIVCTNYQQLLTIRKQRCNHKLVMWRNWWDSILKQVQHPELLEVN